jgi:hypothetical protein
MLPYGNKEDGMGIIDDIKKELAALNADLVEIEDKIEMGCDEYGLKIGFKLKLLLMFIRFTRDNVKDMILEVEDQIIRAEHPEDFPE